MKFFSPLSPLNERRRLSNPPSISNCSDKQKPAYSLPIYYQGHVYLSEAAASEEATSEVATQEGEISDEIRFDQASKKPIPFDSSSLSRFFLCLSLRGLGFISGWGLDNL
jgi:hypothetical protein